MGCNASSEAGAGRDGPAAVTLNSGPVDSRTVNSLKQKVTYLASDALEGRGPGTEGLDRAADFIAQRLRSARLKPAPGYRDYFQHFEVPLSSAIDKPNTSLSLNGSKLKVERDFMPLGLSRQGEFDGEVVFVGYGITSDEHHYDDYSGVDVQGKVVLALRYEPHHSDGKSRFTQSEERSRFASFSAKARAAADAGAAALLFVNPPNHGPKVDLMVPVVMTASERKSPIPVVQLTREAADAMLKAAGAPNLKELQEKIDSSGAPSSMALPEIRASGNVALQTRSAKVKNVIAMLPGKTNPDEFIVVGAHYDHLGRGGRSSLLGGGNEIHNGADDNASGTAAVMELAERMGRRGGIDRSVLFVFFTCEEIGLLGSAHFVENSPVPLDKIVAMINLDMVGRVRDNKIMVGGDGTAEAFAGMVASVDEASPLEMKTGSGVGGVVGRGGFGPSDHQSFAMKKIPVLFLFSGMHPDYHRPGDDVEKINFEGIARVVDVTEAWVREISRLPRQQYVDTYDRQGMRRGMGGSRVALGVVPDYGNEAEKGARLGGTVPGGAAQEAGLKAGDVITRLNDKEIESLYDLTDFLAAAKPGDKVRITYIRDGQALETEATLKARN
jgi:hypothetical protein